VNPRNHARATMNRFSVSASVFSPAGPALDLIRGQQHPSTITIPSMRPTSKACERSSGLGSLSMSEIGTSLGHWGCFAPAVSGTSLPVLPRSEPHW
jgi:hypothetical protein